MLKEFPTDEEMQLAAARVNLSETAFLVKMKPLHWRLRWFTPEVEVKLCGHATIAAAHVLRQTHFAKPGDTVVFHTLSGELPVRVLEKSIELDFPALPGEPCKPPAALKALGVDIVACQKNDNNYLVEVKDYDALLACAPDFKKLKKLEAQGVIVTTATYVPKGYDFAPRAISRRR